MSNSIEYTLKLPSKPIQRVAIASLLLFLATLPVMDIPMSDASFPAHITEAARTISLGSLIVMMVAVVVFMYYRNRAAVYVDDTGIQLPNHNFISWESIQWYRIDVFLSTSGTRSVTLKVDGNKAVILAQNDEALNNLAEDIKTEVTGTQSICERFQGTKIF